MGEIGNFKTQARAQGRKTPAQQLSPDLSPDKQCEILSRGAVDFIGKEGLLEKLKLKRPLRIKAGFDPSKPDLHIGHSILINKLRQFQELGHEVYFIVGDFTACVGDPSGQNKTRPCLSFEEAQKNAKTYMEQATKANFNAHRALSGEEEMLLSFFKRLDRGKTKLVYNSKWLSQLSLKDFILEISSKFTVARQLERNDFSFRLKSGQPIGLHEFLYPILQAYDSVEIEADAELGGTDQLFNLLLGRELMERRGQAPQAVLTLPLLEGIDAKKSEEDLKSADGLSAAERKKTEGWNREGAFKMSKSLGNAIAFNDSPKDIYGKTMKITDDLMTRYWSLFTEGERDLKEELNARNLGGEGQGLSPKGPFLKKEKERLAWLLACAFHGEEMADKAREEFRRVFSAKGLPDQIPEIYDLLEENQQLLEKNKKLKIKLYEALKQLGLSSSNSEARRGILSGAVRKDGEKLSDPEEEVALKPGEEYLFSYGRRKFKRLNLKWGEIHDLKAYLIYRKIKEGGSKSGLCEELSKDKDFESYISLSSIKMKIENYRFLDRGKGLEHFSRQSGEIYKKYKDHPLSKIEGDIKKWKANGKRGV